MDEVLGAVGDVLDTQDAVGSYLGFLSKSQDEGQLGPFQAQLLACATKVLARETSQSDVRLSVERTGLLMLEAPSMCLGLQTPGAL